MLLIGNAYENINQRLLIRNLRFEDYPEFERILNDIQKSAFGGGINFLNKGAL